MTTKYKITKTLRKIVRGEEKPNKVVFCIGEQCNYVRHNREWVNYRSLADYERSRCSSGLCPECFEYAIEFNRLKRTMELFGKNINIIFGV